ncbi:hypothetical protein AB0M02_15550 [Actinoplanes sp. NPDC051861]|uniref:hypothetical protein n=1 Tax=Actinoplanes sp. NPDC051861 TaxID=3155170 RepID=UPI00343562BD
MTRQRRILHALATAVLLAGTLTVTGAAAAAPETSVVPVAPRSTEEKPRAAAAKPFTDTCDTLRSRRPALLRAGQTRATCTATPAPERVAAARAANPRARAATADGPVWCSELGDNQYWYTRSSICLDAIPVEFFLINLQTGAIIGSALLEVSQAAELRDTSASWSEYAAIVMLARFGQVSTLNVSLEAACNNGCTATKSNAWGMENLTLFETEEGTLEYAGNPSGQVSITPTYTLTMLAPGAVPLVPTTSWTLPDVLSIRCDNLVGSNPGCVVPLYTPSLLLSWGSQGAGAVMISWAQQYLADGWGWEGVGAPLRRLADTSLQERNRGIICDGTFTRLPQVPDDSCDEFAFAGSYESGAMLGLSGSDCAEILPYIDDVTGQWYIQYLKPVTGSERCVRAHVSRPSNVDVGGELGRFVQRERLLDYEEYWVATTY